MKLYYRAVTQDGKTIRGLIEAKDEKEAAFYLRQHKLVPITIMQSDQSGLTKFLQLFQKPSGTELVFFTRQLSSMLASGLTLMQALDILKNQIKGAAMSEIVRGMIADIENGKKFSEAIERYPNMFSPIYIALIRTAETSGLLDKVLLRLAETLEKRQELESTIRGALMYPAIVIIMMIVVMTVMMIFVVPQLTVLYDNLNVDLPLPTQIVIAVSTFTTNFWYLVIILVFVGIYAAKKWYASEPGRRVVDTYLLRVPIFGKLLVQTMMAEFTRTLGLLISSGSLVVDSLLQSSDIVGNVLYKDALSLVAKRVEKGISVGDAMEASPLFPPIVVEMVKIGEQTGKLDESLIKASEYFEREVEQTVKTLTTLMEPIIMIILAFGVGFLIIAVITPIYNLMSSIQ